MSTAINIIFDGPPGPVAGRFVEVETDEGKGINVGEWIEHPDGLWALRIAQLPDAEGQAEIDRLRELADRIADQRDEFLSMGSELNRQCNDKQAEIERLGEALSKIADASALPFALVCDLRKIAADALQTNDRR